MFEYFFVESENVIEIFEKSIYEVNKNLVANMYSLRVAQLSFATFQSNDVPCYWIKS